MSRRVDTVSTGMTVSIFRLHIVSAIGDAEVVAVAVAVVAVVAVVVAVVEDKQQEEEEEGGGIGIGVDRVGTKISMLAGSRGI